MTDEDKSRRAGSDAARQHLTEDKLDRHAFAAGIAKTLATRSETESLVVGVYGRWGEGKTTVLNFIGTELKARYSNVIVVRFNPWQFPDDRQLLGAFFTEVASALQRSASGVKQEVLAPLLRFGAFVLGSFKFKPQGADVEIGLDPGPLRELADQMAKVSLEDQRGAFEQGLAASRQRVVVLMDDIDRLDKHEAQAVFRLLKVVADFRGMSYVIACDRDVVAASLAERYPSQAGAGDGFLEKIVQVPLTLPPTSRLALRDVLTDGIEVALGDARRSLDLYEAERFARFVDDWLLGQSETLRAVKRYLLSLSFALASFSADLNLADFLMLEAIRVYQPRLYTLLARSREALLGEGYLVDEFVREWSSLYVDLTKKQRDEEMLARLFPHSAAFGKSVLGAPTSDSMQRARRVCSPFHFDRFFTTDAVAGDDATLADVVTGSEPTRFVDLLGKTKHAGRERLVRRLSAIVLRMSLRESRSLLVARDIAAAAEMVPDTEGAALSEVHGGRQRLAELVARLIANGATRETAYDTAVEILGDIASCSFALQVFGCFVPRERERAVPPGRFGLEPVLYQRFSGVLLGRVKAEKDQLRARGPFDTLRRLAHWMTWEPASLQQDFAAVLDTQPQVAIELARPLLHAVQCGMGWDTLDEDKDIELIVPEVRKRMNELLDPRRAEGRERNFWSLLAEAANTAMESNGHE